MCASWAFKAHAVNQRCRRGDLVVITIFPIKFPPIFRAFGMPVGVEILPKPSDGGAGFGGIEWVKAMGLKAAAGACIGLWAVAMGQAGLLIVRESR